MNRIDEAMAGWQTRQQRYAERYGPDVLQDREFAKVKLKALRRSVKEVQGVKLTNEEKDDLNILKAQIRYLDRKITPNSLLRFGKRTIRFTQNLFASAIKASEWFAEKVGQNGSKNFFSKNVLNTTEPDYIAEFNGKGRENGQAPHNQLKREHPSYSTPLPGDEAPSKAAQQTTHENKLQARRNNKQRFIQTNNISVKNSIR